ncbi:agamous-like MADS-box protein AGL29 [Tripterygium wilfordii]|uniref:agamous-like MADS-box protein AGL29 n=1 Tax=Tripterygium wilfordii TaxID=458696 RepID=UPI0018F842A2|nr:agamous-like MADS-box protein AGL29 [Tripterygium wilfordii]
MGRKRTIPLHERDKKSISVTYSKRRKTLFTKAAETSLQYQIPIAVLVSSAGQRQRLKFCGFGNPSVDDVLNSYLGSGSKGAMKIDDRAKALWEEVNGLEVEVKNMREREKKGEGSDHGGDDQWWLRDIEIMGLDELCEFANRLEKLKEDVRVRLESDSNTGDFSGMVDDGEAKNENVEEVIMDWYWKPLLA